MTTSKSGELTIPYTAVVTMTTLRPLLLETGFMVSGAMIISKPLVALTLLMEVLGTTASKFSVLVILFTAVQEMTTSQLLPLPTPSMRALATT